MFPKFGPDIILIGSYRAYGWRGDLMEGLSLFILVAMVQSKLRQMKFRNQWQFLNKFINVLIYVKFYKGFKILETTLMKLI